MKDPSGPFRIYDTREEEWKRWVKKKETCMLTRERYNRHIKSSLRREA
jgi:hypothetical protein